jgi:hypothetical protein
MNKHQDEFQNTPINEASLAGANAYFGNGDNKLILASELKIDPALHECRGHTEEDVVRMKAIAKQPKLHAPIPVVEKGGHLYLVDGFMFIRAVIAEDPNALVQIRFVSPAEAVAIRGANLRRARMREPMVFPRYALMRWRFGATQEEIAAELGLDASRISQIISAAETEEKLEPLAELVRDRSRISVRFWEDVHTTRERLTMKDMREGGQSTPNMDRHELAVQEIIKAGVPIEIADVKTGLVINEQRTAPPKRRNRMIGKPVNHPGLRIEITVDRKRQGGQIINFPPGYPSEKFEEVYEIMINHLIGRN